MHMHRYLYKSVCDKDVVQYVMNYASVYVCSEMGRMSECMCMCVQEKE